MTPSYASALVQRYMRSSVTGGDASNTSQVSSRSTSPPAGQQRGTSIRASTAGRPNSSSAHPTAPRRSTATGQVLKRDSSVAKRASSLIRTAVDSSDRSEDEQRPSSKQQLPRASASASKSARPSSAVQQVLQRRSSLQGASVGSISIISNQLTGSRQRSSTSTAEQQQQPHRRSSTAAADRTAPTQQQQQTAPGPRRSLINEHAAGMVASYYPGFTASSPPRQTAAAVTEAGNSNPSYPRSFTVAKQPRTSSTSTGMLQRPSGGAFEFPSTLGSEHHHPPAGSDGVGRRRGSASLGAWALQQQQQAGALQGIMQAPDAVKGNGEGHGRRSRSSAAPGPARLSPVPPSEQAPPLAALSPRSSAMVAIQQRVLQQQGRTSYTGTNTLPVPTFAERSLADMQEPAAVAAAAEAETAMASSSMRGSESAAAGGISVSQQLKDITSTAAAAIARARSASAAAAAAAAAADRRSSGYSSSQQQQQQREWGSPGSHNLPPPNPQLAKEAAARVSSPGPGARLSQHYSPDRLIPSNAAAAAAASSDSDDDGALRNVPGYGDGTRARWTSKPQQQQEQQLWTQEQWQQVDQHQQQRQRSRSQSPIRRLSSAGEATAAALDAAATALTRRSSSPSPDPLELAAGVVAKRLSTFTAGKVDDPPQQQQQQQQQEEGEEASGYRGARGSGSSSPRLSIPHQQQQRQSRSSSPAAMDADVVAINRAAKRASLIAEQAIADAAEEAAAAEHARASGVGRGREHSVGKARGNSSGEDGGVSGVVISAEGQQLWQDVQQTTRDGWFQSPDRLKPAKQLQQQQQRHRSASRPGRYKSPPRDSTSTTWQYGAGHAVDRAQSPPGGIRNLQHDFAAAAAAESKDRSAAGPTAVRERAKEGRKAKGGGTSVAKLPGDKLLRKLLTEILTLGPEAQAGSSSSSSNDSSSSRSADVAASYSRQSSPSSSHEGEPPSPAYSDEPSLKALHSNREQQQRRRQQLDQEQQQREQQHELDQRRRAAAAAAFQAGLRAAAEEHYQRCTSPDIVDTAVEAAVASAAAAEVARQVKQQRQQQRGDAGRSFDLSSRSVRSSLVHSPEPHAAESADELLHKARLQQLLQGTGGRSLMMTKSWHQGNLPSVSLAPPTTTHPGATSVGRYTRPSTSPESTTTAAAAAAVSEQWQQQQQRPVSAGRQHSSGGRYGRSVDLYDTSVTGAAATAAAGFNVSPPRVPGIPVASVFSQLGDAAAVAAAATTPGRIGRYPAGTSAATSAAAGSYDNLRASAAGIPGLRPHSPSRSLLPGRTVSPLLDYYHHQQQQQGLLRQSMQQQRPHSPLHSAGNIAPGTGLTWSTAGFGQGSNATPGIEVANTSQSCSMFPRRQATAVAGSRSWHTGSRDIPDSSSAAAAAAAAAVAAAAAAAAAASSSWSHRDQQQQQDGIASVAQQLESLNQRIAATVGLGEGSPAVNIHAAASNAVSGSSRHRSLSPAAAEGLSQQRHISDLFHHEDIMQWPLDPRNVSPTQTTHSAARQSSLGTAGLGAQLEHLQQQQQPDLGFEISYADQLNPHQHQQQRRQQQHRVALVSPMMYVPRHKMIDSAVDANRPPSPLWNQMHVQQKRLHQLQQQQQQEYEQAMRRGSPGPDDLYQPPTTAAAAAAAEGGGDQRAAADAIPAQSTAAAGGQFGSSNGGRSSSRSRAALIPVTDLMASIQALQRQQQQSQGDTAAVFNTTEHEHHQQQQQQDWYQYQMQHSQEMPASKQQQQQQLDVDQQSSVAPFQQQQENHDRSVQTSPITHMHSSPAAATAARQPPTPASGHNSPSIQTSSGQQQQQQHASPTISSRGSWQQQQQQRVPSPGPEELNSMLAGVMKSVQGLDNLMSSLLSSEGNTKGQGLLTGTDQHTVTNPTDDSSSSARSPAGAAEPPTAAADIGSSSDQAHIAAAAGSSDDGDMVNMGSVMPMSRYRTAVFSAQASPTQQRQEGDLQVGTTSILHAQHVQQQQQQPVVPAAVAAAALTIQDVVDHLRSSVLGSWQAEDQLQQQRSDSPPARAAAQQSPQQQQQQQQGLQTVRAGLDRPSSLLGTGLTTTAGVPPAVLQQLSLLESQLMILKQQMVHGQLEQHHGDQQQQLSQQLQLLQDSLQALVPSSNTGHHAAASPGQATSTAAAAAAATTAAASTAAAGGLMHLQQQSPPQHHGRFTISTTTYSPASAASRQPSAALASHSGSTPAAAAADLASPAAGGPSPNIGQSVGSSPGGTGVILRASATQVLPGAASPCVESQQHLGFQVDSPRRSLTDAFVGNPLSVSKQSPAGAAIDSRQGGSQLYEGSWGGFASTAPSGQQIQPQSEAQSPTQTQTQPLSQTQSPEAPSTQLGARASPSQQQGPGRETPPAARAAAAVARQSAAAQLELAAAAAEAQVVLAEQINLLRGTVSETAAEVQKVQQRMQQLETQQQQQQVRDVDQQQQQQQQQKLQQQIEELQQLLQDLVQQHAGTALKVETQAAAVAAAAAAAAAAGTEHQLEPLKEQLQQLEKVQQELLEGSRSLDSDSIMRDRATKDRLNVVEGEFNQHSQAVEWIKQQIDELQQQQQQREEREGPAGGYAAAAAEAAVAAAAAAEQKAADLQQQVEQLESRVVQLQEQQHGEAAQQQEAVDLDSSSSTFAEQVQDLQQQLESLNSAIQQLQQQEPQQAAAVEAAAAAALRDSPELQTLQQQLASMSGRVDEMSVQLQDCSRSCSVTLPLRLSEIEDRVAATAQTCADAVKVIALKHASISAMFAEVQAAQAAADGRLAQLSKQLSEARAARASSSRAGSRAGSRSLSNTGVQLEG